MNCMSSEMLMQSRTHLILRLRTSARMAMNARWICNLIAAAKQNISSRRDDGSAEGPEANGADVFRAAFLERWPPSLCAARAKQLPSS